MRIVVPAEKLAAAVNKYLVPAAIRKLQQEESKSEIGFLKESDAQRKSAL